MTATPAVPRETAALLGIPAAPRSKTGYHVGLSCRAIALVALGLVSCTVVAAAGVRLLSTSAPTRAAPATVPSTTGNDVVDDLRENTDDSRDTTATPPIPPEMTVREDDPIRRIPELRPNQLEVFVDVRAQKIVDMALRNDPADPLGYIIWLKRNQVSTGIQLRAISILLDQHPELEIWDHDCPLRRGETTVHRLIRLLAADRVEQGLRNFLRSRPAALINGVLQSKDMRNGFSPLHTAVWTAGAREYRHANLDAMTSVIRYLKLQGARLDQRDRYGRTPLDLARQYGFAERTAFMQELISRSNATTTNDV